MLNEKIAHYFSKTVADYDTVSDHVVMNNKELHRVLMDVLAREKSAALNVLDLGCGTGHGVELLLKSYPQARVTALDVSPTMIEKCKQRTRNFGERVSLVEGDFCTTPFAGPYDAIISAVAIHNIADQQKVDLFKSVFESLCPGGIFVNGDFIKGENNLIDDQTSRIYREYVSERLEGEELAVWLHHIQNDDKPMRLSDQFNTLQRLGFNPVQLHWLYANEAVYSARRPSAAI